LANPDDLQDSDPDFCAKRQILGVVLHRLERMRTMYVVREGYRDGILAAEHAICEIAGWIPTDPEIGTQQPATYRPVSTTELHGRKKLPERV
jgi:hypothetical protein